MRLAVLGAGAIGPAAAALAVSRGHSAAIWSPSGRGTAGIAGAIHAEGAVSGTYPVEVAASLPAALRGAEAALLALPAYALPAVLPRLAAAMPDGLPVLVSSAASLAPLALEAMRARAGGAPGRAAIGAMGTTPCTARRIGPDRVRVPVVRKAVDVAAVPAARAPEMAALATALFGHESHAAPNAVAGSLSNANPIIHAALCLVHVTRIERREAWCQFAGITPAAARLMDRLEAERGDLAEAYGVRVQSLAESLHRANGVPVGPLDEMGAAISARRGGVMGPTDMSTRYVTEDVPYGLVFTLWLAAARGLAMPVTEAVVASLEALWGRALRDNPLLDVLDPATLAPALARGFGRG